MGFTQESLTRLPDPTDPFSIRRIETYELKGSFDILGVVIPIGSPTEINVIGMTVEEAIFVVDKFLDDCSLSSLNNVRIVHGKGTGKLRQGIHIFLKKHPHVKNFRLGTFGEGEMGVTVVELKK